MDDVLQHPWVFAKQWRDTLVTQYLVDGHATVRIFNLTRFAADHLCDGLGTRGCTEWRTGKGLHPIRNWLQRRLPLEGRQPA
mgnify:CR=1 FL=1